VLGMLRFGQGRMVEGEREYRRALALFPYDPYVAIGLAREYAGIGLCRAAIPLFELAFRVNASLPDGHADYAKCLMAMGRPDEAKRQLMIGFRAGEAPGPLTRVLHDSARAH